jgi:predicted amidohydrolase
VKERLQVSLVQFDSDWLNGAGNAKRMADFVRREADEHGADLVVFPEMATTGYVEPFSDSAFVKRLYEESEHVPGPTTTVLAEAAAASKVHVIFGVSRLHDTIPGVLYNSAVLLGPDGEIIGVHDKMHASMEEKNYYVAGNTADVFDTSIGKLAMEICYDVRFPELARIHALKGAEVIVSIWSSFVQPGKVPSTSIIERCATRSMENGLFFLGCNRSGQEGDRLYYGRSVLCAPSGEIIASSDNDSEEVVRGELLGELVVRQRSYLTVFRDRRPELYGMLCDPL